MFIAGYLFAGAAVFLLQIVSAGFMDAGEFGILSPLLAVLLVLLAPGAAVGIAVSRYVSGYEGAGEDYKTPLFLRKSLYYISVFAAVTAAVGAAFAPVVDSYLQTGDVILVNLVVGAAVLSMFIQFAAGALSGLRRKLQALLMSLAAPVIILILGASFMLVGLSLQWIVGAVAAGYLVLLPVGVLMLWKEFRLSGLKDLELGRKEALRFVLPVLAVIMSFSFLAGIDIVMVRHYFPSGESGWYTAAALGRLACFFPAVFITGWLFPWVNAEGEKAYGLLKKALVCCGLLSAAGVVALSLMGEAYRYMMPVCAAMVPLSLLGVLTGFNLAAGKLKLMLWLLPAGCILEVGLMLKFHETIQQILYIMIGAATVLFAVGFIGTILKKPGKAVRMYEG